MNCAQSRATSALWPRSRNRYFFAPYTRIDALLEFLDRTGRLRV